MHSAMWIAVGLDLIPGPLGHREYSCFLQLPSVLPSRTFLCGTNRTFSCGGDAYSVRFILRFRIVVYFRRAWLHVQPTYAGRLARALALLASSGQLRASELSDWRLRNRCFAYAR